jgi:hypothetical protein
LKLHKGLYEKFATIEARITRKSFNVDEAISQIDYIKILLSNEDILDDLDA